MARVPRIEFRNRIVDPITTARGQHHYYDFLDYWRVCYSTENKCRFPTIEADDAPNTFFMLTKGDRIGIMNDFCRTDLAYDCYETDDENFLIKLHSGSNCKIIDFNNPSCDQANIINEK